MHKFFGDGDGESFLIAFITIIILLGQTVVASRPPSRISSGYGSARSHRPLRPVRKFLTVRPLGGRPRNWPQFRSLRLGKSNAKGIPPTPAPRFFYPKSFPINHSYQNVPPPKVVADNSTTETVVSNETVLPLDQPKCESVNGIVNMDEKNSEKTVQNNVEKLVGENKVTNVEGNALDKVSYCKINWWWELSDTVYCRNDTVLKKIIIWNI